MLNMVSKNARGLRSRPPYFCRAMRNPFIAALFPVMLTIACNNGKAGPDGAPLPADRSTPDPWRERDTWQKPEELIALMGQDLSGMTIVDLFAEDGYFSFRMVAAGARVIAVVNDPANAERIEERKKELGLGDDRLVVRTVPSGDPGIGPNEADMALLAHHFLRIADRKTYFQLLRRGLKEPRPLFMLEWQDRQTPMGPPVSERRSVDEIMDMVSELEYSDVGAHSAKIPDQVIFVITDYIDLEGADM
jgi:hypothetical protein